MLNSTFQGRKVSASTTGYPESNPYHSDLKKQVTVKQLIRITSDITVNSTKLIKYHHPDEFELNGYYNARNN